MKLSIYYDPEKNIYFKKVEGIVTLSDVLSTLQNNGTYDISQNIYLLEDVTMAKVGFSLTELYKIISQAKKVFPKKIVIFHAIVTHSKITSAFVYLYKSFINVNRYKLHLFSSSDNALEWIEKKQSMYEGLPPK